MLLCFIRLIITLFFANQCVCSSHDNSNPTSSEIRHSDVTMYDRIKEETKQELEEINSKLDSFIAMFNEEGRFQFIKFEEVDEVSTSLKNDTSIKFENGLVKNFCDYVLEPSQKLIDHLSFLERVSNDPFLDTNTFIEDGKKVVKNYKIIKINKLIYELENFADFLVLYTLNKEDCKEIKSRFSDLQRKSICLSNSIDSFCRQESGDIKQLISLLNSKIEGESVLKIEKCKNNIFKKYSINEMSSDLNDLSKQALLCLSFYKKKVSEMLKSLSQDSLNDSILLKRIKLQEKNEQIIDDLLKIDGQEIISFNNESKDKTYKLVKLNEYFHLLFYEKLTDEIYTMKNIENECKKRLPELFYDFKFNDKSYLVIFEDYFHKCLQKVETFDFAHVYFLKEIYIQFLKDESLKILFLYFLKEKITKINEEKEKSLTKLKEEFHKLQKEKNIFYTDDFDKFIESPSSFLKSDNKFIFLYDILSMKYNATNLALRAKIKAFNTIIDFINTIKKTKQSFSGKLQPQYYNEISSAEFPVEKLKEIFEVFSENELKISELIYLPLFSPELAYDEVDNPGIFKSKSKEKQ